MKDDFEYRWFYKRKLFASAYSFESVKYSKLAFENKEVVTYTTAVDNDIIAVSRGSTCAILYDKTSTVKKLTVVRFVSQNDDVIEDLFETDVTDVDTVIEP